MSIKYNPSTVDVSSNFAIGTYNLADNPNLYEIARSNNFEFLISDFDNLQPASSNDSNMTKLQKGQEIIRMSVTRASVPHFTQEVIQVRRGNNLLKYAGVPTFGEGSLIVNDYIGAGTKDYLMAWQNLSYNVITEKVGLVQDYKKNCTLIEYSPDYQVGHFMVAGLAVCQKTTLTATMATLLVKFLQQFSMTTLSWMLTSN